LLDLIFKDHDILNNFLEEAGSNLSLVLDELESRGGIKPKILHY
jgi:hypothetical protein